MSPPPKVCLVTPSFPPRHWGGLAASAGRVAAYAAGLGLEVHVALARPGPPDSLPRLDELGRDEARDGLTIHHLTLPGPQFDPARRQPWDDAHGLTLRALGQTLELLHRRHGFSLLHSFFLFPMGYVTGLVARRLGLPHLATVVGDDLNRFAFSPAKLAALGLALEGARAVVFLSPDLKELAAGLAALPAPSPVILNSVRLPRRPWRPAAAPAPGGWAAPASSSGPRACPAWPRPCGRPLPPIPGSWRWWGACGPRTGPPWRAWAGGPGCCLPCRPGR